MLKKIAFFVLPLFILTLFRISFAIGSFKFFFSGMNFLAPMFGFLLHSPLGVLFLSIIWFCKFHCITFGLPTIAASLCWALYDSSNLFGRILNFVLMFLLPLAAIVAFILHPVGVDAYLYSFYWFIPALIYLVQKFGKKNNYSVFYFSFGVSFVMHAIGSIIWLYTIPMTSIQWISLIPVVFFERLFFSVGSVLTYFFIKNVNFYFSFLQKRIACYLSAVTGVER